MNKAMLPLLLFSCAAVGQTVPEYTVEVHRHPMKEVVVCRVLAKGEVVGGGDNCDFHLEPDPVFCRIFQHDKGCRKNPEGLPLSCGTSFGCQNLAAIVPSIPAQGEQP